MRTFALLLFLSSCAFAQTASSAKLGTVGEFVQVCGRDFANFTPEQMANALKSGDVIASFSKALADNGADQLVCMAYLEGLIDGWQDGHEHGVLAMEFPAGVPDREHLSKALDSQSKKGLEAASAAM